ncbi:hypothetical protein [Paraburkholderia sp. J76]|uniref:hypothetical protein n=1 Tax=Paraburkholderia sp. J76 TaxID=2805439 RepID=UPI002ABD7068|nr:hypothetical protein [Paraburkholderia sp. J76]
MIAGVVSLVQANQAGPFGGLAWILGGFLYPLVVGGTVGGLIGGCVSSLFLQEMDEGNRKSVGSTDGQKIPDVSHLVPGRSVRTGGRIVTFDSIAARQSTVTNNLVDLDESK